MVEVLDCIKAKLYLLVSGPHFACSRLPSVRLWTLYHLADVVVVSRYDGDV